MRVTSNQEASFADSLVNIPTSQLDIVNEIINWNDLSTSLSLIRTDYNAISLFKALLIGTWHNLSDESLADSLKRDLVFINFCNFSLTGNKPDATTLLRFRDKLIEQNLFDQLLTTINTMLETNHLKLSNGKHVAMDATLIQSSRPKKVIKTSEVDGVHQLDDQDPIAYSDDKDAKWTFKAGKFTDGYSSVVTTDANGLINKVIPNTVINHTH